MWSYRCDHASEPWSQAFRPTPRAGEMLGTRKAIGRIDVSTAPVFGAFFRDAIDGGDEALVRVDCSAVTFLDLRGFGVLVNATEYAVGRGHTLVICNPSPSCARLIQLYDRDRELRVESSLERIVVDCKGSGLEAVRSEVRALREAGQFGKRPRRGGSTIDTMRSSLGHLVLSLIAAGPSSDESSRDLAAEALHAWDS